MLGVCREFVQNAGCPGKDFSFTEQHPLPVLLPRRRPQIHEMRNEYALLAISEILFEHFTNSDKGQFVPGNFVLEKKFNFKAFDTC